MARCVDDVDAVFLTGKKLGHSQFLVLPPLGGDGGGGDGDTAFALLFHPVGRRATIVDFADFVNHSSVK